MKINFVAYVCIAFIVSACTTGNDNINNGDSYNEMDDYELAIERYTKALVTEPNNIAIYFKRANAYAITGNHLRAIADYTTIIEFTPTDANAYYNRSIIYADMGDYKRTIIDTTKVMKLDPGHADAQRLHDLAINRSK